MAFSSRSSFAIGTALGGLLVVATLASCQRQTEPNAALPPGDAAPVTAPPTAAQPAAAPAITDQDISDAYIYLLGRALVARQQALDQAAGMGWNQLAHRKPGAVDWPNPNLDVAYSEAWVAVDEHSCTLVHVPKVTGLYYTVQFLNGWGETLANINERLFPQHASGEFAVCLKGADVALPAGTQRIDLPVRYSRVLARVELGDDPERAEALQHAFSLKATGQPALPILATGACVRAAEAAGRRAVRGRARAAA